MNNYRGSVLEPLGTNQCFFFYIFSQADLSEPTTVGQDRLVEKIIHHPKYLSDKAYYDVGIAIADKPVEFNEYVIPVCLPLRPVDDVDYLQGDLVTLAGWGSFYNLKNEIQVGSLLKLINLRVSRFTKKIYHIFWINLS